MFLHRASSVTRPRLHNKLLQENVTVAIFFPLKFVFLGVLTFYVDTQIKNYFPFRNSSPTSLLVFQQEKQRPGWQRHI